MRILHGEQHLVLHRPMPTQGRIHATHRLRAVEDKGPGRGTLIHFDIELHDADSGDALASLRQVQFLRGDGGCGHWGQAPAPCAPMPADWRPEAHIDYRTSTQAALLYRLASRDMMPLHADPSVARTAGFDRPISHGLNNLGLACRALLKHLVPGRPERLRALSVRFVQPSFPGETIRIEWGLDDSVANGTPRVRFRGFALERHALLMDRGEAEILAA
jgi:acyl dehydratase